MREFIYKLIYERLKEDFVLQNPKDKNLAHFATPLAFSLAKRLKKNPMIIAAELTKLFKDDEKYFKVEALKGYINFTLSPAFLDEEAFKALKAGDDFAKGSKQAKSFLLEFVSANPTGPLHIGHARGAVYGDTLGRVAKHLGFIFDNEYYINDTGKQIELLGLSLLLAIKEELGEKPSYPKLYYRGAYLKDLAKKAFVYFDKKDFSEKDIAKLASFAKDLIIEGIKDDLKALNVEIASFVNESSYIKGFEKMLEKLKDKSYVKEGKLYIKSSEYKDEKDRVIVRENGLATYLAADILYHENKLLRGFDTCINIWGADHHGYIDRLRAALYFLGLDETKLEVIFTQMVALLKDGKPYKMSKRAGNSVLLREVLDEIGEDALRFIFLSKKCDTHLEFDLSSLSKKDSTNPVYYINYAHARVCQLFIKAGKKPQDVLNASLKDLDSEGLNLAFEALNLKAVLEDAFKSRQLQKICDYLKNLASLFHKYYTDNKVINSPKEDAYLKLFALVALSIRVALDLIGIKALARV